MSGDPLDQVLLQFSEYDPFTIRDACEGIQIFGGTGSGKTSGSGAMLARSFLAAGFGGLVLTVKTEEANLWRRYLAQTGRAADLIAVGGESKHRFNAMEYECKRPGLGAGITENLVGLFDALVQVATRGTGHSGAENEGFWRNEIKKLLRNTIDLLSIAKLPVTIPNIHKIIQSAPYTIETLSDTKWQEESFCYDAILAATERKEKRRLKRGQKPDLELSFDYWTKEFPRMDERPRTTVVSMFTGMADVFLRGTLRELYSTKTTFAPEDTLDGRVIVFDMALKDFNEVAIYAQVLFKYCWQRSIERRRVEPNSRPVFLWIDESQHFVGEHDVTFQTTARGSRACTVLLTQNIPNYLYSIGGGARAKALVDSLLGNMVTKIFHNNTCAATNQYAAELFAQDWAQKTSTNSNFSKGEFSFGSSSQPELQYAILPREFTGLMKGGPPNGYQVEAIIHQGGKIFPSSETNALRTVFQQSN